VNGLNMEQEIGIMKRGEDDYPGHFILNIDCFKWVERDSYLPNGSRGLKAVCKEKLRFNPVEVDPEEMVPMAHSSPQKLAVYSVSDAVATFHLYEKYIHRFILALCYIIPLPPEDVLRQGSGTLCEHLLMAEAFEKNIIFPNKHEPKYMKYWKDPKTQKMHFIFDDSYVGGKVESLKCGIYRDDIAEHFHMDASAFSELIYRVEDMI
ncbi:Dna polymerase family B protein, partial [Cardiosporidium cionae]